MLQTKSPLNTLLMLFKEYHPVDSGIFIICTITLPMHLQTVSVQQNYGYLNM